MSHTMMPGLFSDRVSNESPSRAAAPGARFCTTISACSWMRRFKIVWASGCLTSRVKLSLDRFVQTKCDATPRTRSSYPRAKSPTPGRSTLMTRAPRSASWRVAKGPAIACSRVMMVVPVKGRMFGSSRDHRGGIHGQPAFVILRPQTDGPTVLLRHAADEEGVDVEGRPHRPEAVLDHLGVGPLLTEQVEQQGRDQRAVDDQAGISLDLRYVSA